MKRLITGPRAIIEALRAQPDEVHVVYTEGDGDRALQPLMEEARRVRVTVESRSRQELDALAKGVKHQGVIAIAGSYSYLEFEVLMREVGEAPLLVALDEITDPHNFGAIIRSAVALGADGIITLKNRAAPITPVVVRVSAGGTEHARITRVTNLARCLEQLRERGIETVGLDGGGDCRIDRLGPAPGGRCLIVGSEGKGLRRLTRKGCDRIAQIPLPGPVESLNASVAAGIAIQHAAAARAEAAQDGLS